MRRFLRPLWILLALLFLVEAWLWDDLEPVVARLPSISCPGGRVKVWLAKLFHRAGSRPGLR